MTLNLVDCGNNLPSINPPVMPTILSAPTYNNSLIPNPPIVAPLVAATSTEIHIDFLNRHITNTIPKYFEFDVALSDDVDTGYFNTAEFEIDYPPLIFGTDVVGASSIIVTTTGTFAGSTAYTINPTDDLTSNHKVIIQIVPNGSAVLLNLPDAGPVLTPTIHVRMAITDCFPFGYINMTGVTPIVHPTWSDSPNYGSGTTTVYSHSFLSPTLYFPSCKIHIDNITASSLPIKGGTGDTVTISGFNFDTARGNGNVWIRTANDDGSYIHLDSIDYVPGGWNDSIIKFIMPGEGLYIDSSGSIGVPGSGRIKVQNNIADTAWSDSTTVWYSISSSFYTGHSDKYMLNLANVYSFQHGYEFKIDTAFEENLHPDRWNAIDVAIKEWVCLSGVNFIIGDTLTPRDYLATGDTICRIQFGKTTSQRVVAQTQIQKVLEPGCDRVITEEIDLIVDSTRKDSLWWDTDCHHDVPVGKYDAYATILHELGHGHSLNHVNDSRDIMYWLDRGRYGVPANQRKIYIKFDQSANDAANYVTTKAADPLLASGGCAASLLGVRTIPDCDSLPRLSGCWIWVEEIHNIFSDAKIFPNPAHSKLDFGIKCDYSVTGYIEIKDIFGRVLLTMEKQSFEFGWNYMPIDVNGYANGIYCIGIHTKDGSAFTKFIKE